MNEGAQKIPPALIPNEQPRPTELEGSWATKGLGQPNAIKGASSIRYNKVNENMNFKIERYPASAETLETDRTNVAIAISEDQWGRIDQHVVEDSYAPRSPMLFPEVRMSTQRENSITRLLEI